MAGAGLKHLVLAGIVMMLAGGAFADDESWRAEFNEVCDKTSEATTLSSQELKSLIDRCDRIQKSLAGENESVVKVYTKRVRMCRDLFRYVLDTREAQEKAPAKSIEEPDGARKR